jgi:hypothetical protein
VAVAVIDGVAATVTVAVGLGLTVGPCVAVADAVVVAVAVGEMVQGTENSDEPFSMLVLTAVMLGPLNDPDADHDPSDSVCASASGRAPSSASSE